jgi:transketolase
MTTTATEKITTKTGHELAANTIRCLAMDAVQKANSGHPGMPMGMADVATVLWSKYLRHNPADPKWFDRDRFVLSAGHGSMLLYALLHLSGYDLSLDDIKEFRQWGSKTPGHPEVGHTPGVETTTGPLGQGIANAVGMTLAEAILAERYNREGYNIIDHFTYVIVGDGCLMEGISHEACSLAGHLGLGKLIMLYDDNGISIDGSTDLTFTEDVLKRFRAYGWHVQRIDGHDPYEIEAAIEEARRQMKKPSLIACQTHIGFGSPNRQDSAKAHGEPLGSDEIKLTKEKLGWQHEDFYVPEEARRLLQDQARRGNDAQKQHAELLAGYKSAYPELAAGLEALLNGELPQDWESLLPSFTADKPIATRAASGAVLDRIIPKIDSLIGGSADLTGSNNTLAKGIGDVQHGQFDNGYVRYGVREHGMGAIMNGLALHGGFRPFGGTFLVFSDYMRPAVRMAALMRLPVIFVFTHDSIGLGEDGPTHQPIEHLASLRLIPGLNVVRPADANETREAWRLALKQAETPTALVLTRQALPIIERESFADTVERGGYVLADADDPRLILIATGSEVQIAVAAREQLVAEGISARVVSMPCCEVFDAQDHSYKESVLPAGIPRIAVEAASPDYWRKYIGIDGEIVGLDHFGASAPAEVLFEKFGITTDAVVEVAKKVLLKRSEEPGLISNYSERI